MARSVAADIKAAVIAAWTATPALVAAVPIASLYAGSLPAGVAPPYAQLIVKKDGEPQYIQPVASGNPFVTKRMLTVKVWAISSGTTSAEDALGPIVAAVQAKFGNEAWSIADSVLLSSLPGNDESDEAPELYQSESVWVATIPFNLTLQRNLR